MSSQTVDVHARPIDTGEGPYESKQPKEAKRSGDSDWRGESDDVDPMAAQVGKPTSGGEDARAEFEDEEAGQGEFDCRDLRALGRGVVDDEPERPEIASAAMASSHATSCVMNQPLNASRSCNGSGRAAEMAAISPMRPRDGCAARTLTLLAAPQRIVHFHATNRALISLSTFDPGPHNEHAPQAPTRYTFVPRVALGQALSGVRCMAPIGRVPELVLLPGTAATNPEAGSPLPEQPPECFRIKRVLDPWKHNMMPEESLAKGIAAIRSMDTATRFLKQFRELTSSVAFETLGSTGMRDAESLLESRFYGPSVVAACDVVETVTWNALVRPLVKLDLLNEKAAPALMATLMFEAGPRHDDLVRCAGLFLDVPARVIGRQRLLVWDHVMSRLPETAERYNCDGITPSTAEAAVAVTAARRFRTWAVRYPNHLERMLKEQRRACREAARTAEGKVAGV